MTVDIQDVAQENCVKRPRTSLKLTIVLASTVLTLFACELLLQIAGLPGETVSGWKGEQVHAVMSNQLGYRGHPINYEGDDYVIVLLGDSQVHAIACAYDWMPERRLEHHLNEMGKKVRVVTIGAPGWGQDQQLLAIQDYFASYRADLVLLWQSPVNDVWNNMFPTHMPRNGRRKPTFWLESGKLCGPTQSKIGRPIDRSSSRLLCLIKLLSLPELRNPDEAWEEKLPPAYTPLDDHVGDVSRRWQERAESNPAAMEIENLGNEKSHLAFRLTPRSARMEYGLKLSNRLLHEIRSVSEENSAEMIVFTSVVRKHQRPETVEHYNGKYYRLSQAQHTANVQLMQEGLRAMSIDVTVDHPRVSPRDAHLNEHAVDQVMRDLAKQLVADLP